ncbi:MAG: C40 family peptidase [Lachnospiraceae bacterium]|nr:C40 family peptidase [Lachnospiraceae bacterium]
MVTEKKSSKFFLFACAFTFMMLGAFFNIGNAKHATAAINVTDYIDKTEKEDMLTLSEGQKDTFVVDEAWISANQSEIDPNLYTLQSIQITYNSDDTSVLKVDEAGAFEAVSPGSVTLDVKVKCVYKEKQAEASESASPEGAESQGSESSETGETYTITNSFYIYILVFPDMTNVTLEKTSFTFYTPVNINPAAFSIKVNSDTVLDENTAGTLFSYKLSDDSYGVVASLDNNVITVNVYYTGSKKIIFNINGKEFKVTVKVKVVKVKGGSFLLAPKKTKVLNIKNDPGTLKWKSNNTSVATVNKKGKVKAKKVGNALIYAKVGTSKIGVVVSVAKKKKIKVVNWATKYAKKSTYSQPKRMYSGYYDCSSLVWRAYHAYGINVVTPNYAPVAADQAHWLASKKRMLKGGLSKKNIKKMKINAGDLFFETGAKNGRYKGIYHVEMIAGYEVDFDSSGKPTTYIKWANRPVGYYGYAGQLIGRMK